jgi:thiosulfate/3-mercaptopyruvate sulfurtransferase
VGERADLYWVDPSFVESRHGALGCPNCHEGDPSAYEKPQAHIGLLKDPSGDAARACGLCHAQITERYKTAIHATLNGFETVLKKRAGMRWAELEPIYQKSCVGCHATCGNCHIARHPSGGGGLLSGHQFFERPPAEKTCGACHGGRVAPEYYGRHEGQPPDVHFAKAGMDCFDCHDAQGFHGTNPPDQDRFSSLSKVSCLNCHGEEFQGPSKIAAHDVHGKDIQCQVCHSVLYKGCYECHIGKGAKSKLQFKIGKSLRGDQPYRVTLLRHVPIARDTFSSSLRDALPDYDLLPNWKGTSPHNIQRVTYRNQTCDGCHGNSRIFLRATDLLPEDPTADAQVIFPHVPSRVGVK